MMTAKRYIQVQVTQEEFDAFDAARMERRVRSVQAAGLDAVRNYILQSNSTEAAIAPFRDDIDRVLSLLNSNEDDLKRLFRGHLQMLAAVFETRKVTA